MKGGTSITHGATRFNNTLPEYSIWSAMRNRCNNPNDKRYYRYGGRGIKVCSSWEYYENFIADMGRRPSNKLSIDRINNDGPYSPDNCRWADKWTQSANRGDIGTNTSGYNGVDWVKPQQVWRARIESTFEAVINIPSHPRNRAGSSVEMVNPGRRP